MFKVFLLVVLLISAMSSTVFAHSDKYWANYFAPKKNFDIVIDGSLEEWKDIPAVKVEEPLHIFSRSQFGLDSKHWEGKDDHSFSWRIVWDEEYLYIAVAVVDDVPMEPTTLDRNNTCENDTVELIFDTLHDGKNSYYVGDPYHHEFHFEFSETTFQPPRVNDNFWIFKGIGEDGVPIEELKANGVEANFADLYKGEYRMKRTDNGYNLELKIKLEGLALERATPGTVTEGLNYRWSDYHKGVFGFDISVNDNDVDNRTAPYNEEKDHRDSLMFWTTETAQFWRSTERLGNVYLLDPINK